MGETFAPALLRAVVDTLLPGDGVLPGGSAAGVVLQANADASAAVLRAIIGKAGGGDAFVKAGATERAAILAAIEAADATAFRAMLLALLQDYFDSDAASGALGWRADPPQPRGHELPPTDETTWCRLDAVRRRGKMWRDAG